MPDYSSKAAFSWTRTAILLYWHRLDNLEKKKINPHPLAQKLGKGQLWAQWREQCKKWCFVAPSINKMLSIFMVQPKGLSFTLQCTISVGVCNSRRLEDFYWLSPSSVMTAIVAIYFWLCSITWTREHSHSSRWCLNGGHMCVTSSESRTAVAQFLELTECSARV